MEIALSEAEILEASGPIPSHADLAPVPAQAAGRRRPPTRPALVVPPVLSSVSAASGVPVALGPSASGQVIVGWRSGPSRATSIERRPPHQRAVDLFDRGLELRAQGHFGAALDAWEKASRLAPDNRVYQANAARLRAQLAAQRSAGHAITGPIKAR